PVYKIPDLEIGDSIVGPAILADGTQTIVVTPEATALILETHVVINVGENTEWRRKLDTEKVDPIMLSIFAHRFMAIAEQMVMPSPLSPLPKLTSFKGRALQKTSVS